jgi:nicotinate-nucleotide adenylyltransferase
LRLAIFGGTFDPVHHAHLSVAREAARRFGLDRVLLVPAGRPPHKAGGTRAPYEDRYRMVELACAGEPGLAPSRLEEGTQNSYSIDTIEKVRAALGPEDRLFFIIGADAFAEIQTWRRWQDVLRAVEFIVVSRPGHRYAVPGGVRVARLDNLELPVSSSEIRARLARGEEPPEVPAPVLAYIRERRLYRG